MISEHPHMSQDNPTPASSLPSVVQKSTHRVPQEKHSATRPQLWTPFFVLIIMATLCCFMVGQGLNAGTSVFLDRLGESATFAGILATVFSIAAAATRLFCGPIIDQTGRYGVIVGGMVLLFLGTMLPALLSNQIVFIACRIVQGIGFSAATTALATAAADVLPTSRLGEGIGYYGLGQALAMSIGPALGLFLVATNPAANLYFGLAIVAVFGCLLAAGCRYEYNPSRLPATATFRRKFERGKQATAAGPAPASSPSDTNAEAAREKVSTATAKTPRSAKIFSAGGLRSILEPRALPGALPMLVLSPAFGFGIFFVGLYGTSLHVGNPGLFYTLSALSMIAIRLKSSAFMDRVEPRKVFAVAILGGLVCYALLFAANVSPVIYYAAGIFYGICLGISMPLNQSVAVKNTPPDRWGATNALFLLATDIGVGMSTLLWGVINDAFGFTATIACVMVCIVAAYAVAWVVYPRD